MTQEKLDNPFGRLVVDVPECFQVVRKLTSENNALLSEVAQLSECCKKALTCATLNSDVRTLIETTLGELKHGTK